MKATCVDCGAKLVRGYYIEYREFERMKKGNYGELIEMVLCLNCDKIAIMWDEEKVAFETYENVHNVHPDTENTKEKK